MSRPWLLLLLGTEPVGSRGFGLGSKPATPARLDSGCGVVAILHTAHGRLSERPMEADCKSVAKATKVRILHLPPSARSAPAEHEAQRGPTSFLSGGVRVWVAVRAPCAPIPLPVGTDRLGHGST